MAKKQRAGRRGVQQHKAKKAVSDAKAGGASGKALSQQPVSTVSGLTNLGNTCFFNATVQSLSAAPVLRDTLLGDKGEALEGSIAQGLRDVVCSLYRPSGGKSGRVVKAKVSAVNPQRLFAAICAHAPHFKGYQQHDSHELFGFLLNGLEEEEEAANRERRAEAESGQEDDGADIVRLSSLFVGKLAQTVSCGSCGYSSVTYEPFKALSLPVPSTLLSRGAAAAVPADREPSTGAKPASNKPAKAPTAKEAKRQARQEKRDAIRQARLLKSGKQGASAVGTGEADDDSELSCATAVQDVGENYACDGNDAATSRQESTAEEGKLLGGMDLIQGTAASAQTAAIGSSSDAEMTDGSAANSVRQPLEAAGGAAVDGGTVRVQECMSAFFGAEPVAWECPQEAPQRTTDAATPQPGGYGEVVGALSTGGRSRRTLSRRVSFSDMEPDIKFIPGSSEQRGTDFRAALRGHVPFRRPLSYNGASLLVTADVGSIMRDKVFMRLQPYDDDEVTMCVLSRPMRVSTVQMDPVQDSDDDEEQLDVMARAQVLMDCVADMVAHHGVVGLRAMTLKGMALRKVESQVGLRWQVHGPGHLEYGGPWQYPTPGAPRAPSPTYESLVSAELGRASSFGSFGSLGLAAVIDEDSAEEVASPAALSPSRGVGHAMDAEADMLFINPMSLSMTGDAVRLGVGLAAGNNGSGQEGGAVEGKLPGGCEVTARLRATSSCEQARRNCDLLKPRTSDSCSSSAAVCMVDGEQEAPARVADSKVPEAAAAPAASPATPAASPATPAATKPPRVPAAATRGSRTEAMAPAAKQPAVKQYAVESAPAVLCIHLKRFYQDGSGRLKKINGLIPFDYCLDLSQYCTPNALSSGSCRYELVGIVEHSGTMRSGHYVAYVRRDAVQSVVVQAQPGVEQQEEAPTGMQEGLAVGAASSAITEEQKQERHGDSDSESDNTLQCAGDADTSSRCCSDAPAADGGNDVENRAEPSWHYVSDSHVRPVAQSEVSRCEAYMLLYVREA